MKQDLRKHTCCILKRGNKYLQGVGMWNNLVWSTSAYDAWRTRDLDKALRFARKTGADVMLFNPIVSQLRPLESV